MWRFALGFIAGAYVHKHYDWPDVDSWIEKFQEEEKSRRKK
jgi:hypothetical protein